MFMNLTQKFDGILFAIKSFHGIELTINRKEECVKEISKKTHEFLDRKNKVHIFVPAIKEMIAGMTS